MGKGKAEAQPLGAAARVAAGGSAHRQGRQRGADARPEPPHRQHQPNPSIAPLLPAGAAQHRARLWRQRAPHCDEAPDFTALLSSLAGAEPPGFAPPTPRPHLLLPSSPVPHFPVRRGALCNVGDTARERTLQRELPLLLPELLLSDAEPALPTLLGNFRQQGWVLREGESVDEGSRKSTVCPQCLTRASSEE